MAGAAEDLGAQIASYGMSPVYMQRAAFVAVLSFACFMPMMFGFYLRQSIIYFLGATAFLLIYLLTLFTWLIQRKSRITIFEDGLRYKGSPVRWEDIADVDVLGEIRLKNGRPVILPRSTNDLDKVVRAIRLRAGTRRHS